MIAAAALILFAIGISAYLLVSRVYFAGSPGPLAAPPAPLPPPSAGAGGGTRVPLDDAAMKLGQAIARFEGFFRSGSRAQRNNNPGNLRRGGDQGDHDEKGYGIFTTAEAGWSALFEDVKAKITGRTRTGLGPESSLFDFFKVYAPQTENPTAKYASFVAGQLKITTVTRFSEWVDV